MGVSRFVVLMVALGFSAAVLAARDGPAIWDSRCEECHGDPAAFSVKYMWNLDGKLEGQHHTDDMHLFLENHYIPKHEIEAIRQMLLAQANSPRRFVDECGECHGKVEDFVEATFWVGKKSITSSNSGLDVAEFLQTHRDLTEEDITFYQKLFFRVAGKPIPSNLISKEPGLQFK